MDHDLHHYRRDPHHRDPDISDRERPAYRISARLNPLRARNFHPLARSRRIQVFYIAKLLFLETGEACRSELEENFSKNLFVL